MTLTGYPHPCEKILQNIYTEAKEHLQTFQLFGRTLQVVTLYDLQLILNRHRSEFLSYQTHPEVYTKLAAKIFLSASTDISGLTDNNQVILALRIEELRDLLRTYVALFYDYKHIEQPDFCIHEQQHDNQPISVCCYPIHDCVHCPNMTAWMLEDPQ